MAHAWVTIPTRGKRDHGLWLIKDGKAHLKFESESLSFFFKKSFYSRGSQLNNFERLDVEKMRVQGCAVDF